MKFDKITRTQQNTLRLLHQAGCPSAVIAGGCLRDSYFGRDYKDVDIFVDNAEVLAMAGRIQDWKQFRVELGQTLGLSYPTVKTSQAAQYDRHHIMMVWEYVDATTNGIGERHPYDIIAVKGDPIKYIDNHFDVGICKTWFDGKRVHYSADFMADVHHKTLTVCGKMTEKELAHCVKGHLQILQEKFPNHTVVIDHDRIYSDNKSSNARSTQPCK